MKANLFYLHIELEIAVPEATDMETMKPVSKEIGDGLELILSKHNILVGKINVTGERINIDPVEFTQH